MLAGANDPVDADSISHTHVSQVLPLLAQNFDYVIVDTAAGLDERTLAAIECATDLLLVSSLDVTSIRSLRKALDALDHIGVTAQRQLVLNRSDSKVGLNRTDAEDAIGMSISCSIPSSLRSRCPSTWERQSCSVSRSRRWPSSCSTWRRCSLR